MTHMYTQDTTVIAPEGTSIVDQLFDLDNHTVESKDVFLTKLRNDFPHATLQAFREVLLARRAIKKQYEKSSAKTRRVEFGKFLKCSVYEESKKFYDALKKPDTFLEIATLLAKFISMRT